LRSVAGMRNTNWTTRKRGAAVVLGSLGLAAALLPGHPARACGGLFCNQPQNTFDPPPVAQTGENVLFAMEKDPQTGVNHLEAHVQIFYGGPADRFSWVVPVDSKPELDVGTNQLFKVLVPATNPTFNVDYQEEGSCKQPAPREYGGSAGSGGNGGFAEDAGAPAAADGAVGISVSFRGDIGPYDAVVIKSTNVNDAKPLKDWLTENKYYISSDGSRLIDDYVREDKYFVAIRLINGHSVNEIQPLVMRFDGPGPCVPLKLTSIAAINDLRVNLWVLAETRVVPQNYFEIKVNPIRIDWFHNGGNYDDLVKKAADEAGGNAFVTDFVGDATVMQNQIYAGRFDTTRLSLTRTPPEAMQEINVQGFPRDAALLEILRKDLPEPQVLKDMGVSDVQFYGQLAFYWQTYQQSFAPFDARVLAADITMRIVQPLAKAQALFDRFRKLSRLSTFISPEEMTVDPLFMANSTLPDVPANRQATAYLMCGNQKYTRCQAPIRLELPDGQKLYFKARANTDAYCYDPSGNLDRTGLDETPALVTAYQRESVGEGAVRVNNQPAIEGAVNNHNLAARAPMAVGTPGGSNPDPSGGDDTGGAGGTVKPRSHSSNLFGCNVAGADGGGLVAAVIGAAMLLSRRRRQRR
jgi:MYXO-CTERM domain-containing protein